ncbi:MAG: hypothetical protein ACHP7H_00680 [Hyphomicrobiales bacterium]
MNRTEWQACAFALATVSEQVTEVLRAVPAGDPEKLSPEWQAIGRLCDASRGLEGVARMLVELANAGAAAEARPELHARILREARALYDRWCNDGRPQDLTTPAAVTLIAIGRLLGGA